MAKVTNEKKLEALKGWLRENNVEFEENHVTKAGLHIDVWIPSLMIAVHLGDDDGKFYKKTCCWCKPFFIRETETLGFVLEKIQNCCFNQMVAMQNRWQKQQKEKK